VVVESASVAADSIQSLTNMICEGSTTQLNVKGGSLATGATWNWYQNSCGGTSVASGPSVVFSPLRTTTFFVRGEGICNTTSCVNINITVLPKPDITFDSIPNICQDEPDFQLTEAKENSGMQGMGTFSGRGISLSGMFSASSAGKGRHLITYNFVGNNGCSDAKTRVIVVNPLPIADAGNDFIACADIQTKLNGSGGASYQWSPITGLNNPSIANPTLTINTNSTYVVKVTDVNGCSAIDSVHVFVAPYGKESFKMANAFTPNHDGHNDCFGIRKWGNAQILEFAIYNRWGEKIFKTTNASECWDGTYHGVPQEAGGYIYVIRANTTCGEIALKGVVTLIR
jgi:gliding motility-associated-like protein